MKQSFKTIFAALAILAAAFSCAKEAPVQDATDEIPATEQISILVTAPSALTKVDLAQDPLDPDGEVKLTWSAGDQITINEQTFTLKSGEEDKATAIFEGTAPTAAASYNISYSGLPGSFAAQTQASDGSTAHLRYGATLTGVDAYDNVSFNSTWAASHGGTFAQSSIIRLRAQLPAGLAAYVKAVTIKADQNIFDGGNAIVVDITTPGDTGSDDVLNIYATLPAGAAVAIPAGTNLLFQFQTGYEEYEKYTALRTLASAAALNPGQVNAFKISCPNIQSFANASDASIGTSSNPYLIGDQNQLYALIGEMVSGETVYAKLVDDIDMTDIAWTSLNNEGDYDKAINFDGQHHTVSNLTADDSAAYPSFAGVANGVYKDVTFDKAVINGGSNNMGVFAGYIGTGTGAVYASCSGITVSNSTVTASAAKTNRNAGAFAGMVGHASSTITDCHVTGTTSVSQDASYNGCSVAGFIGNVSVAATISNCTATADLSNDASYYTGGFIGQIGSAVAANISNCAYLGGNITAGRSNANSPVAGFVGRIAGGAGVNITDCYVDGANITAPNSGRIGGFVGDAGSNATANCFTSCYVKNTTISGGINSAGFAGTYGTASKCYVESTTVTANADNAGGFVAYLENGTITNCYSSATVVGGDHKNIGGFVGNSRLGGNIAASVTYSFANGTVSGSDASVGAFIGGVTVSCASVTNCIAWNDALSFIGSDGGLDVSAITDNYVGNSGTISAQATALGWDGSVWDLIGDVPTLK